MRFTKVVLLISFVSCLIATMDVSAQPMQSDEINQLRAGIRKLEEIDARTDVSAEIKELNRGFLTEQRAKLLPLLQKRSRDLRAYLASALASLSTEQILKVQQSIKDTETEIGRMQNGGMQNGSSTESTTDAATVVTDTVEPTPDEPTVTADTQPPADTPTKPATPLASNSTTNSTASVAPLAAPLATAAAATQPQRATIPQQFNLRLRGAANDIRNQKALNPNSPLATFNLQRDVFLLGLALAMQKVKQDVVPEAENARTDKQIGGNEKSGGTTSLVSKGGVPTVFGFAVENGALTRTDSGTTVTFRGNPAGIIDTLRKQGYLEPDSDFERFIKNFSFGISFDTSRGDAAGMFTGDQQQLSGYSLRYNFINRRDPRSKRFTEAWSSLVKNQAVPIASNLGVIIRPLIVNPPPSYTKWETALKEALRTAKPGEEEQILTEHLNKLPVADLPPALNAEVTLLANNLKTFFGVRDDILKRASSGLIVTGEYINERRPGLPSLSNIRFIAEQGPFDGAIDLTANASITFYNSKPTGMNTSSVRDFRLAGQIDVPFGDVATTGKFLLSFAGRYERLMEDEMMANGMMIAPKGDIGAGQIKLTIPVRGTAFKIPLSFSFANRTELIKEREVRGNFGFTFDLDSILARFNPFTR